MQSHSTKPVQFISGIANVQLKQNSFLYIDGFLRYGRGYDWYNSAAKLAELRRDLAADNILVSGDNYYVAGYDGPRVYYMNRYHEIWIGVL